MGVVLEIRTAAGELVTPTGPGEHSWVLEESRSYRLRATHGAILQARLDVRDLPRIDPRTVDLTVGFWTAQCRELHVVVSDRVVPASVRVVPRAEKLDEATWLRLVDDLEAWLPGLSVGAGGGTTGGVAIEGVDSPGFAAAALLPLVPALLLALRAVTTRPREHSIETSEYVRLRMIRRADAGSLGWLTRHGSAAVAVDAWRSLTAVGPEPHLPQWRSEENLDHPVNRYVVWALDRARSRLETLADRLTRFAGDGDGDTAVWCRARADAARASALQVAAIRTRSFLRGIRPAPPTETSMLAVRDDPAYSRFHKLVRPFLSPRFARDQDDPSAPARPTYELYELWTLLAICRALAARLPATAAAGALWMG